MPKPKLVKQMGENLIAIATQISEELTESHPHLNHVIIVFDSNRFDAITKGQEDYCLAVTKEFVKVATEARERKEQEQIKKAKRKIN